MALPKNTQTKVDRYKGFFIVLGFIGYLAAVALFFYFAQAQVSKLEARVSSLAPTAEMNVPTLEAQAGPNVEYTVDQNTGQMTFITNPEEDLPLSASPGLFSTAEGVAKQFLSDYGVFFGLENSGKDLAKVKQETDQLGMFHLWYDQKYNGVPVYAGQIGVHIKSDSDVRAANGRILPGISIDTRPRISEGDAQAKAQQVWQAAYGPEESRVLNTKLYVFNKGFVESKPDDSDHLVWLVDIYKQAPTARELYFIDAHTGELVYQLAATKSIYRRIIDCSLGACVLDYSYGGYTYGRSEGQPVRGANPLYGGMDVDQSYDMAGGTQDYFAATFGRDGANNKGGIGDGTNSASSNTDVYDYINYAGYGCPNAFFDGFSLNFCEGLVANDIFGHEYTHGVIDFSVAGGMTYSYQTGAIQEGVSDFFGEGFERYETGSANWEMGEGTNVPGFPSPLRDLKDPPSLESSLGRYPDRFNSGYFYCGAADLGGVHQNSTVISHAAYLMVTGGSFNGCSFGAVGWDKTQQIFYRAVTKYFATNTDFNGAYNALNAACEDLYGTTDCNNTKAALQAAELNLSGACSTNGKETPSCRAWSADSKDLSPLIIATSGPGETTRMQVYDKKGSAKGAPITNLFPSGYKGGAGVVAIDANNNGVKDQVAIFARVDGGPQVRVLGLKDDQSQILLGQMFVFPSTNRDGLSITVGDFDEDGFDDDIATCLTGATEPTVRVYKDAKGIDDWDRIGQFKAPFGKVGCNLGTFQYDDGPDDILVSPYQGPSSPSVYIYTVGGTMKKVFSAYGAGVTNGVTPSGIGDRIYTTPNNGTSHVNVFDRNGNRTNFWWVYARHIRGDFINTPGDIDSDGVDEVVTAPFGANGPHILSFEPSGKRRTWPDFFAFNKNLRNGVGIAVTENWHGKN